MLWVNGHTVAEEDHQNLLLPFHLEARGIFETLRIMNGKLLFSDDHLERLNAGLSFLNMDTVSNETWETTTEKCVRASALHSGRLRYMVYTPAHEDISHTVLHLAPYTPENYIFPEHLTPAGDFSDLYKPAGDESSLYKLTGNPVYRKATMYCRENGMEECYIRNDLGHICETLVCNIYLMIDGAIYTPPLSSGCIAGVMRKHFLRFLHHQRIPHFETELTGELTDAAETVFGTNVIRGIRLYRQRNIDAEELLREFIRDLVQRQE